MDWLLPLRRVDQANDSFEVVPHSPLLGTFGSFLMACSVRAASATVRDLAPASLRADFLSPPPKGPIRFEVERTRSGRSVAVRRVVVGSPKVHAVVTLSFANREARGKTEAAAAGAHLGEDPEALERYAATPAGLALLDARPVRPVGSGYERRHPFWARPAEPFGGAPGASAAAIALASDHFVTALATPIEDGPPQFAVTLDHSIWFHRLTDADEWLRYDATPVLSHGDTTLIRGSVQSTDGESVATFMQQAMRREGAWPRQ